MSAVINIPLTQLYTVVGEFLQAMIGVDPATGVTVAVTRGQINLVPMPSTAFINMQAMVSGRLSTNEDSWTDSTQITQQSTKVKMHLDFYGPLSHDWATIIEALWRDTVGCNALAPTCAPLYSDEPIQSALVNGEENYEDRWVLECFLQYNPTITTPQQSAAPPYKLKVYNVDEKYPPS